MVSKSEKAPSRMPTHVPTLLGVLLRLHGFPRHLPKDWDLFVCGLISSSHIYVRSDKPPNVPATTKGTRKGYPGEEGVGAWLPQISVGDHLGKFRRGQIDTTDTRYELPYASQESQKGFHAGPRKFQVGRVGEI